MDDSLKNDLDTLEKAVDRLRERIARHAAGGATALGLKAHAHGVSSSIAELGNIVERLEETPNLSEADAVILCGALVELTKETGALLPIIQGFIMAVHSGQESAKLAESAERALHAEPTVLLIASRAVASIRESLRSYRADESQPVGVLAVVSELDTQLAALGSILPTARMEPR